MKRDKRWGQDNPRDQARVILGAIEGELINMQEGIASTKSIGRAIDLMQEVKILIHSLESGSWD